MKNANHVCINAKKRKDDEFYTRYDDVEKELSHYNFNEKKVFCPCDSPASAFVVYFKDNFQKLGLKSLTFNWKRLDGTGVIATTFDGKVELVHEYLFGGFESIESTLALKECDIVVTNPPFSLARKFIQWIVQNNKSFIIVGNVLWLTYKVIFENLIINGQKIWGGYERICKFYRPNGEIQTLNNTIWFQNINEHFPNNIMFKRISKSFMNYMKFKDVIYIDRLIHFPLDYSGKIAVPISFLLTQISKKYTIQKAFGAMSIFNSCLISEYTTDGVKRFKRLVVQRH